MLLGLTYQLVRFITDLVLVRTRSDAQLRAKVLALRHQLLVLERKVGKPAWQPADRILLAGLHDICPRRPGPLEVGVHVLDEHGQGLGSVAELPRGGSARP